LLALSLAKLILFVLDSNPQVFLGDSMSYLTTAMKQRIPPDRSFVYGYLVNSLTARSRSLNSLLAVQSVMGIATSMLSALILFRFFRVSFAVSAAIAFLMTLEAAALRAIRHDRKHEHRDLCAVSVCRSRIPAYQEGMASGSVAGSGGAPGRIPGEFRANADGCDGDSSALRYFARHEFRQDLWWDTSAAGNSSDTQYSDFWGFHTAYKRSNGSLSHLPSAYSYSDGFFLLSNVSPLVTAADTDNAAVVRALSQLLVYASLPEAMNSRNSEMFNPDGIVERLKAVINNDYKSNLEACGEPDGSDRRIRGLRLTPERPLIVPNRAYRPGDGTCRSLTAVHTSTIRSSCRRMRWTWTRSSNT